MSSLLMPDHAALFRVLEGTCVRRWGWTIRSVSGPDDLIRKMRAMPADLVLLFAGVPDWPAAESLKALRAEAKESPFRALLVGAADDLQACGAHGADATLQWPATAADLEATIASLTRQAPRTAPRRQTALPARLTGAAARFRGRLRDIGPGGAFIVLGAPLPLEAPVSLAVRLPSTRGEQEVAARGVVVRQVAADEGSHRLAGVAIRFVDLDAPTREALDHFARGRNEAPPGHRDGDGR